MLRTETICNLYGETGLEQFLGKEQAGLVDDTVCTDGYCFALGDHIPIGISDIEFYLKMKNLGVNRRTALRETIKLMVKHKIDLIH